MKRKTIAKKFGILILAFGLLAAPTTSATGIASPVQAAADTSAPEDTAEPLELSTKTYKKTYKTDNRRIYKKLSFTYPVAAGDSDAANAFNQVYKKTRSDWLKSAKENLEEAKELIEDNIFGDDDRYYSDEVTCEITYNDEDYISILQTGYDYSMGAHGLPYRISYIFDAKTGNVVSAADLLECTQEQLNTKIRKLYLKKFDKTQNTDAFVFYANRKEVKKALEQIDFNENSYYLKNGKLRFYVDPYAVGPYAAGFIEVTVKL